MSAFLFLIPKDITLSFFLLANFLCNIKNLSSNLRRQNHFL